MASEDPVERHHAPTAPGELVLHLDGGDRVDRSDRMAPPLTRDEYDRRHTRLVWAIVAQFVFIVIAVGLAFTLYQGVQHDKCVDNLQRTRTAARLLPSIITSAEADGDTHQAAFWRSYLADLSKAPPAQC